ncbi:MliC family protein [Acetobacter malorum]|nr:MliC family protein [Acetobacter malorum]
MNVRKTGKKGLTLKMLAGLAAAFGVLDGAGASNCWAGQPAVASTLSIPLMPASQVQKSSTTYRCSGSTELLDKLAKPFVSVTYLNAGAVSLAVLQVEGETQVFSNVISASGARYTANRFEWWSKGDTAFFSEVGAEDTHPLTCRETHQAASRKGR